MEILFLYNIWILYDLFGASPKTTHAKTLPNHIYLIKFHRIVSYSFRNFKKYNFVFHFSGRNYWPRGTTVSQKLRAIRPKLHVYIVYTPITVILYCVFLLLKRILYACEVCYYIVWWKIILVLLYNYYFVS